MGGTTESLVAISTVMMVKRKMATSCQSSSSGADDHDRDTEAHKSEERPALYTEKFHSIVDKNEVDGVGLERKKKNRPVTSRGLGGCEGGRARRGVKVDEGGDLTVNWTARRRDVPREN